MLKQPFSRFLPLLPSTGTGLLSNSGMRLDKAAVELLRQENHTPVAFRLVQRMLREKSLRCGQMKDGSLVVSSQPSSHLLRSGEVPVVNWRSALGARLLPTPLSSACQAAMLGDSRRMHAALRAACGSPASPTYADAVLADTLQAGLLPPQLQLLQGRAAQPTHSLSNQQTTPRLPSWCTSHPLLACLPDLAFVHKPGGVLSQGGEKGGDRGSSQRPHLLQLEEWILHQRRLLPAVADPTGQSADAVHPPRLRVGHRLDQGVSGVVAMPLTRAGAEALRRALSAKSNNISSSSDLTKTYFALVQGSWGANEALEGVLTSPGGSASGQTRDSRTEYAYRGALSMRGVASECSLLQLRPISGHKHQLRVHCSQLLGKPILGDSRYGGDSAPKWLHGVHGGHVIALHAHSLSWAACPLSGAPSDALEGGQRGLRVAAPLPRSWMAAAQEPSHKTLLSNVDVS